MVNGHKVIKSSDISAIHHTWPLRMFYAQYELQLTTTLLLLCVSHGVMCFACRSARCMLHQSVDQRKRAIQWGRSEVETTGNIPRRTEIERPDGHSTKSSCSGVGFGGAALLTKIYSQLDIVDHTHSNLFFVV